MECKLNLISFSRNDVNDVKSLINEMKDIVDEVVVVDSSDEKRHNQLLKFSKENKKVRIYYVVPLGYVEPLRMYALKKCRSNWVLLLDADERLNKPFKKNLRKIIKNAKCNAYSVAFFLCLLL